MTDSAESIVDSKIKVSDEMNSHNVAELRKVFIIQQVKTQPDLYQDNRRGRKKRSFVHGLWCKMTIMVNKNFPKDRLNGKSKFLIIYCQSEKLQKLQIA